MPAARLRIRTRPDEPLSTPVVPGGTTVPILQVFSARQGGSKQEAKMLAWGVEMHFSGGSQQGMLVQDSDFQAASFREAFQFLREINFLGSKEFVAKPANFMESRRIPANHLPTR